MCNMSDKIPHPNPAANTTGQKQSLHSDHTASATISETKLFILILLQVQLVKDNLSILILLQVQLVKDNISILTLLQVQHILQNSPS